MEGNVAVPTPVRVHLDSHSALDLVNNPVRHARSEQILAQHHFVRDSVHSEKEMVLEKIFASQMEVDMLTKHASASASEILHRLLLRHPLFLHGELHHGLPRLLQSFGLLGPRHYRFRSCLFLDSLPDRLLGCVCLPVLCSYSLLYV